MTELCEIMNKNNSDKGRHQHNYTKLYYELFKDLKNEKLNIFELGLGTNNTDVLSNMGPSGTPGASLRGWKDFFVNSEIYGADIDKRILFNENKIKTYYCDQTNPESINELWNNPDLIDIDFDIIIEDGLHTFDANICFLNNSLHKLKKGGIYIVEDLTLETISKFEVIIDELRIKYNNCIINIEKLENPLNTNNDNNLLIIKNIE